MTDILLEVVEQTELLIDTETSVEILITDAPAELLTVDDVSVETLTDTELLTDTETSVEVVATADGAVTIFDVAEQGPPGPQGPQGVSGGSASAVVLAIDVGGHRAVTITQPGAVYADAFIEADAGRVAGITTQAGSAGQSVLVQSTGFLVELSWTWTPGADIWLGANGILTHTMPANAVFAQRLGYATSPTSIWVEISEPVVF